MLLASAEELTCFFRSTREYEATRGGQGFNADIPGELEGFMRKSF